MTTVSDFTIMNQTVGDFPIKRVSAPEARMEKAKIELISNIVGILKKSGVIPDGDLFDRLDDMSIPELHSELIKAQDAAFNFNRQ